MYQNIENLQNNPPSPAKCAKAIKLITFGTGALVIAFGVVGIIFLAVQNILSLKFFLVFSPVFIIILGGILIAIELKIEYIVQNFGFLRTLLGRAMFNFFISTQVYYYFSCAGADSPVLAWTTAMVMFALGVLYLGLHFAVGRGYSDNLRQELQ